RPVADRVSQTLRPQRVVLPRGPASWVRAVLFSGRAGDRDMARVGRARTSVAGADVPGAPGVGRSAAGVRAVHVERRRGTAGEPVFHQPLPADVLSPAAV